MASNATVMIVVVAMAALLFAGMFAGVVFKTRTRQRRGKGETIRDQAERNALQVRYQEGLADEFAVKAYAAQVEVDIKTARICGLQRQEAVHRSEAATCRDQLNKQRNRADKLNAAAQTPETPRLAG